jgi:hypothetical protein
MIENKRIKCRQLTLSKQNYIIVKNKYGQLNTTNLHAKENEEPTYKFPIDSIR